MLSRHCIVLHSLAEQQYLRLLRVINEPRRGIGDKSLEAVAEIAAAMDATEEELVMAMEAGTEIESLQKTIYQGDGADISLMDKLEEKHNKNAKNGWFRYNVRFALPVCNNGILMRYNIFSALLLINYAENGRKYLYDILAVKKETSKPQQDVW